MLEFLDVFVSGINSVVSMLDNTPLFGVISLWDCFAGGLILLLIISVFWKGAGT